MGKVLMALVFAGAAASSAALAQERQRGYLGVGFGGVLPATADFAATDNVQLPGDAFETIVSETTDLEPNGGLSGSVFLGLQVTPILSFEAEGVLQLNSFDDDLADDDDFELFGSGLNMALVTGNIVIKAPVQSGFQPYVGVGAGPLFLESGDDQLRGFEGETVIGYQVKGGIQYRWPNGSAIGLQLRHMATAEPLERSFERDVLQPDGFRVATELTEELDYAASDVQITFTLGF